MCAFRPSQYAVQRLIMEVFIAYVHEIIYHRRLPIADFGIASALHNRMPCINRKATTATMIIGHVIEVEKNIGLVKILRLIACKCA